MGQPDTVDTTHDCIDVYQIKLAADDDEDAMDVDSAAHDDVDTMDVDSPAYNDHGDDNAMDVDIMEL